MADIDKDIVLIRRSDRLAIASLVLAVMAMFGVVPLAIFPFFISCAVVDWIGCSEFDFALQYFYYTCIFSICASILAIILGILSHRAAEKESNSWIIASVGIGIGLIVWPLILVSGILLWLGSMW